jgi:hypothetical protein
MMKNHRLRATFHVCSRTGWIAWITFFLLTSTLAAYGGNTTPKVLAKIDGKVLTSKDFASYLALFKGNTAYQPKTLKEKKRLLEYLIDRTLLLEAAKKEGYDKRDLLKKHPSLNRVERETLMLRAYLMDHISHKVSMTDKMIASYRRQHPGMTPKQAREILTARQQKKLFQSLMKRLKQGRTIQMYPENL